jgi:hypothetical protein
MCPPASTLWIHLGGSCWSVVELRARQLRGRPACALAGAQGRLGKASRAAAGHWPPSLMPPAHPTHSADCATCTASAHWIRGSEGDLWAAGGARPWGFGLHGAGVLRADDAGCGVPVRGTARRAAGAPVHLSLCPSIFAPPPESTTVTPFLLLHSLSHFLHPFLSLLHSFVPSQDSLSSLMYSPPTFPLCICMPTTLATLTARVVGYCSDYVAEQQGGGGPRGRRGPLSHHQSVCSVTVCR